ncbi:hypothetical protein C4J87_2679 [Pseudomonas sp. R1-43-08]|nr:hypothetical protein C4J87_2679 [Pseudomonas sp. R1-43-08]
MANTLVALLFGGFAEPWGVLPTLASAVDECPSVGTCGLYMQNSLSEPDQENDGALIH